MMKLKSVLTAITVSLFVFCSQMIYAQWSGSPDTNTVVCSAAGSQIMPLIVSDNSGGSIVVWKDTRNNNADIYAQRIDASGYMQWTPDGIAVCTDTNEQKNIVIASDGQGGVIAAWQDLRSGTEDIYAQRINSDGTAMWMQNGVPICTAANDQTGPSITSDGEGGAVISWEDKRNNFNKDVYAQKVNDGGAIQWTEDGVEVCTAANDQQAAAIASDNNGGAIITWQDFRGTATIYAQRVLSNGLSGWPTDGVLLCTNPSVKESPVIASDGKAGAIIVWIDRRNNDLDLFAQRIGAAGNIAWGNDGKPISVETYWQVVPCIIPGNEGGALITWEDQRSGVYDIYAQKVDSAGNPLWALNGAAVCTADQAQYIPQIVETSDGGAIIAWYDTRYPANGADVYAQKVDNGGTAQWTADGVWICGKFGQQNDVHLTKDAYEGAVIVWSDLRNGDYDIYAQEVDQNGNLGTLTGIKDHNYLPERAELYQNYPNPFNPTTTISFLIPQSEFVSIKVYNSLGETVSELVKETKNAGEYTVSFDAGSLASGIYFYRIAAGTFVQTRKMILLK